MTPSTVIVQTTPESQPSMPNWMGEVAAFAQLLTQTGILTAIIERVRFARMRMGTYDLIDFIVVLMGYALSGEPTLQAFYERLDRNARPADAPRLSVLLHGLPARFFETFGSPTQAVA